MKKLTTSIMLPNSHRVKHNRDHIVCRWRHLSLQTLAGASPTTASPSSSVLHPPFCQHPHPMSTCDLLLKLGSFVSGKRAASFGSFVGGVATALSWLFIAFQSAQLNENLTKISEEIKQDRPPEHVNLTGLVNYQD